MTAEDVLLKKKEEPKGNPLYPPTDPNMDWSGVLVKKHPLSFLDKLPRIRPYVAVRDLNNSSKDPHDNAPMQAIEIGIKGTF